MKHPGRHPLATILLFAGTIAGFAHGCASLRGHHESHRKDFERHVAKICTEAAREAK